MPAEESKANETISGVKSQAKEGVAAGPSRRRNAAVGMHGLGIPILRLLRFSNPSRLGHPRGVRHCDTASRLVVRFLVPESRPSAYSCRISQEDTRDPLPG
jgi:hypothetical protein